MKKILSQLLLFVLVIGIITPSCNKKEESSVVLTFDTPEVVVSADGGQFSASYTLEGASNLTINASCTEDWISNINTGEAGVISFEVQPNTETSSRSGLIEISASALKDNVGLTVIQLSSENHGFMLEILETKETTIKYNVYPVDQNMSYITKVIEKSVADAYEDDEALFLDDVSYFKTMAELYGISYEEYLQGILKKGNSENVLAEMLRPDTEYCIYVYGMTETGERASDISRAYSKTLSVEMVEMDFQFEVKVDRVSADISVYPSDKEIPYMFDIFPKEVIGSEDNIAAAFQENLNIMLDIYTSEYEMTVEEVMQELSVIGPGQNVFENLEPYTEYYVVAVAVTPYGTLNSDVSYQEFRTEHSYLSDNDITIAFSNLTDSSVDYKVLTTNDDPFVFGYDLASNWAGYTYEAMLEELVSGDYNIEDKIVKGDQYGTLDNLSSKTEYIVYMFGYENGTATTDLILGHFTTVEPLVEDVTFELVYDKYFDGTELETAYPDKFSGASGKVVVPVVVSTTGDVANFYYGNFKGDYTSKESLTDVDAINTVVFTGTSAPTNIFYLDYDQVYTFIGVAEDRNGSYGQVWRVAETFSKDGVSPASEYEEPGKQTVASRQ